MTGSTPASSPLLQVWSRKENTRGDLHLLSIWLPFLHELPWWWVATVGWLCRTGWIVWTVSEDCVWMWVSIKWGCGLRLVGCAGGWWYNSAQTCDLARPWAGASLAGGIYFQLCWTLLCVLHIFCVCTYLVICDMYVSGYVTNHNLSTEMTVCVLCRCVTSTVSAPLSCTQLSSRPAHHTERSQLSSSVTLLFHEPKYFLLCLLACMKM